MVHDQANEHEGVIQKPIYEFGNKFGNLKNYL